LVVKEESRAMTQAYKIVIERNTQGGYTATFPELMDRQTQAGSLKALMECIREVVALCPETRESTSACLPAMSHRELES
jgi:predicted RNase H-like HicB family nuclease